MNPPCYTRTGCECASTRCPEAHVARDCREPVLTVLYRVDQEDETGTAFCGGCEADAYDSGLFTSTPPLPTCEVCGDAHVLFTSTEIPDKTMCGRCRRAAVVDYRLAPVSLMMGAQVAARASR